MSVSEPGDLDIRSLVERLPGVYYRCRNDENWTMVNMTPGIEQIAGYPTESLLNNRDLNFADLIHPDDRVFCQQVVDEALNANRPFSLQYRIISRDGRLRWCWEHGIAVYDNRGVLQWLEGFIADISDLREKESCLLAQVAGHRREVVFHQRLLEQYKSAVDSSAIVSKTDVDGHITYVNGEFCRISGFSTDELIGATHALVRHPDTPDSTFVDMWRTIRSGNIWKGVIKNRNKSGHTYYVNSTMVPIFDETGAICEFMSVRHDVTDLVEKESQLRRQTTDALTGLPNRQKLLADLKDAERCSLALVNIIDFSEINEYFGYRTGDRLLQYLAVRLDAHLQEGMQLYRLAGDEFAVLGAADKLESSFEDFCHHLIKVVEQQALQVDEQEFSISIAVGAASGDNAFIEADIALHCARDNQRSFEMFDGESRLKQQIESNIRWVKRIRDAISDDRIQVYAQPIINASTGVASKYECLMRLQAEDGKVYTPYFFLESAKRARLSTALTRIVIRKAFEFFAQRNDDFSINLTAHDILDSETAELLLQRAVEQGVASRLILELVESEGIENFEQVSQFLGRARAIGCRIAVDDFGTGYSNFEYLLKLEIDYIKIDGSLIRHVDTDRNSRVVAETVVDFARRLELETVAEFVHSNEVKAVVEEMGVDYLQGFLLGEPAPLDQLPACAVSARCDGDSRMPLIPETP